MYQFHHFSGLSQSVLHLWKWGSALSQSHNYIKKQANLIRKLTAFSWCPCKGSLASRMLFVDYFDRPYYILRVPCIENSVSFIKISLLAHEQARQHLFVTKRNLIPRCIAFRRIFDTLLFHTKCHRKSQSDPSWSRTCHVNCVGWSNCQHEHRCSKRA